MNSATGRRASTACCLAVDRGSTQWVQSGTEDWQIVPLESDQAFVADSKLLEVEDLPLGLATEKTRRYWSGEMTDEPKVEMIVAGNIKVIEKVEGEPWE